MRPRATLDDLTALVTAATGRRPTGLDRVHGGTTKGVYRVTLDDASTVIVYLWSAVENYWPDTSSSQVGLDWFTAAHRHLTAIGVRVVQVYLISPDGSHGCADAAVVEDVPGGTLQALLERDPVAAAPVMARFVDTLTRMRQHTAPAFGQVALVEAGVLAREPSCEQGVLERARVDLAEAAGRDARIGDVRAELATVLEDLAARVPPRQEYSLVHGELGLDHVLVDADGLPVMIDIEGLMFFDVEWEHVFLELRLGVDYDPLRVAGLEPHRLTFYLLAQRLSLIAGPLRLLDGDFPDRGFMQQIVEWSVQQALTFLD